MADLTKARLMLVALCLSWGLTWPAMRIALIEIPPFSMRATAAFVGATAMIVLARLVGRKVDWPPRHSWPDIFVASLFNIIIFSICAAFAQLSAMTGRVAILVYTMPIWAALLARPILGEKLNLMRGVALALCCVGLTVLIYPLTGSGIPGGLLLALGSAVSWAIGTIYLKWRRFDIEPFTLTAWQLIIAFFVMCVFVLYYESSFRLWDVHAASLAGVAFSGLFGSAIAYYLWFHIIRILPATTASLGALASPVIGLVSSIFLLGEHPTLNDIVGFALIFSASACVLLQPASRR
jgi:drug/metabolite transporter (DMT)-like permease